MGTSIVIRKLNDNIRRLYNVRQADRYAIVSQIASCLTDATPISVLRLDIEKFYENVNRSQIL